MPNINMSLDQLFGASDFSPAGFLTDNLEDIGIMQDISEINLDEIDLTADTDATKIVQGLAGYFIDEEYLKNHPYIQTKVQTEMDMVRRLVKMLKTNESSQDSIIKGISLDPSKAALYSALTALQNTAGALQKQLREHMEALESIFQKMEDDTERTFALKDKEETDGIMTVRGTKEFILQLREQGKLNKTVKKDEGNDI